MLLHCHHEDCLAAVREMIGFRGEEDSVGLQLVDYGEFVMAMHAEPVSGKLYSLSKRALGKQLANVLMNARNIS
jgi:hypothetical protein